MADEVKNMYQCPNCHSENIQKYEVAFQNGIADVNLTTTGGGVGGDGLFAGAARSNGTQQSALSISTAPPQKKGLFKPILSGIVGGGILSFLVEAITSSISAGTVVGYLCFFGGLYGAYQAYQFNKNDLPKLLEQWRHSYVCLRCGHRFLL